MVDTDSGTELMASIQDRREMEARAAGAFDAAVCFQQYAEWLRCGTPIKRICGSPAKTLNVSWSNNMTLISGDAIFDEEVMRDIIHELNLLTDEADPAPKPAPRLASALAEVDERIGIPLNRIHALFDFLSAEVAPSDTAQLAANLQSKVAAVHAGLDPGCSLKAYDDARTALRDIEGQLREALQELQAWETIRQWCAKVPYSSSGGRRFILTMEEYEDCDDDNDEDDGFSLVAQSEGENIMVGFNGNTLKLAADWCERQLKKEAHG